MMKAPYSTVEGSPEMGVQMTDPEASARQPLNKMACTSRASGSDGPDLEYDRGER